MQKSIESWTKGWILPFPKKGDLSLTTNYRGISLTAIAAKIFNLMLLNRIHPHVDPLLRKNQNGFRTNRSTSGHILIVGRILERVKSKNLPLTILYIDFSKAFYSINCKEMNHILIKYGIPEEISNAIMMLYKNTQYMVRSPYGVTSFFKITTGVLQGDTLAQFLLIVCLNYVLKNSLYINSNLGFTLSQRRSRCNPELCITDIDYVDDIAITTDSVNAEMILLHKIEEKASYIGLKINTDKTEFTLNQNQHGIQCITLKSREGHNIKRVEDFKYLGSYIGSTKRDVNI